MMRSFGTQRGQQLPQGDNILASPDKGEGEKVDPHLDADADVVLIFFRERGKVDLHAREVDMPARTELAGREQLAAYARGVLLDDLHANHAAVDQNSRADADIRRQPRIVDTDAAHALGRR